MLALHVSLVVVLLIALDPPARADAPDLRYRFQTGQSLAYSVRIEGEEEDFVETLSGSCTYTVRAANDEGITLTSRASLVPQRRTKSGSAARPAGPLFTRFWFNIQRPTVGPFMAPNEIHIDPKGRVLRTRGEIDLPWLLGDLTRMIVEPLPEAAPVGTTWEAVGDCNLVVDETPVGPPFSRAKAPVKYAAQERTIYTLDSLSDDSAIIKKRYDLSTRETVAGTPRMRIVGEGEIRFAVKAGVLRSMEFRAHFIESTRSVTRRTPVTMSYKLQGRPPAPVSLSATTGGSTKAPGQPLSKAELAQALADLKTNDLLNQA